MLVLEGKGFHRSNAFRGKLCTEHSRAFDPAVFVCLVLTIHI